MRIIGIEEHWSTSGIARALDALPSARRDPSTALNERGDTRLLLEDLAEVRRLAMDEQGVDMQVLALAPPATQALDRSNAVALSRAANDRAAEVVRRDPARFAAMATLPLADPAAAAAELERADGLGLVGTMVYGRTGDVPLDDPRFDDLLGLAERLAHPVFIHPQIPSQAIRSASYDGFDELTGLALATFAWGWHLEAAVATLRLIAAGTFDRHPDLQLVLGHWGELLLFWHERIESVSRTAHLDRPVSDVLRQNLHVTSSGMLEPAMLRHALQITTIDRLLFSTDFPFQRPSKERIDAFFATIEDDEDRTAFASGNARRLFRIEDEPV